MLFLSHCSRSCAVFVFSATAFVVVVVVVVVVSVFALVGDCDYQERILVCSLHGLHYVFALLGFSFIIIIIYSLPCSNIV